MSDGITRLGRHTEQEFCKLTGATKTARQSLGDAILEGHIVEIKKSGCGVINQVRPAKFLTLVVFHQPENAWYVVPAHEVVKLILAQRRGQHTENAFECAMLNVKQLSQFKIESIQDLKKKVISAAISSKQFENIKHDLLMMLSSTRNLFDETKMQIAKHL